MKRAIWALAIVAALAGGCGWQTQNLQGNRCMDSSCSACTACGNGGLRGRIGNGQLAGRVGNGQLAGRLRAGAQMGPPHVDGNFLDGLRAAHQAKQAGPLPGEGTTPTVGYPYYTIRGPRDFLQDSPMPIGY